MNTKVKMVEILLKGDLSTGQKKRTVGVVLESEDTKERMKIFDELIRGGELTQHQLEEIAPVILLEDGNDNVNDQKLDKHDDVGEQKPDKHDDVGEQKPEMIVSKLLREVGIPAHIKGYSYIREALVLVVADVKILDSVTKELYPSIAEKFETTPSRVERGIRHAIEVAWSRGNIEMLNSYFGYTVNCEKGKPTNLEFIALLSDDIRLKYF